MSDERDGNLSQRIGAKDPRFSSLINWAWAAIGTIGLMIGVGVYTKLSELNDTLIRAVSQIETQGDQIKELKAEQLETRRQLDALRMQVGSLEGKTLRGIQEMQRGR